MRVVIATVQVPFVWGGAERLAAGLHAALATAGHSVDTVAIPFKGYPPERVLDHMLACRLIDITESCAVRVDRVVALRFPAYLVPHPNKVVWLLHQHRAAYDLWEHSLGDLARSPNGTQVRKAIRDADRALLPEARAIFTISATVSQRLRHFCDIDGKPLYPPPPEETEYYCAAAGDYFFFPSRLHPSKRQELVVAAVARTTRPVRVCFAGVPAAPDTQTQLSALARDLGIAERVRFLGLVSDVDKRRWYAESLGVVFPPVDEDCGFVTLEAMLAAKPVITCADSGGTLEFVVHEQTGLVVPPTPDALAVAMDRLWDDRHLAQHWGQNGRQRYADLKIGWPLVVEQLLT